MMTRKYKFTLLKWFIVNVLGYREAQARLFKKGDASSSFVHSQYYNDPYIEYAYQKKSQVL